MKLDEARERICRTKETDGTGLDLSHLSLETLPKELLSLKNLRYINISYNQLRSIDQLVLLPRLKSLVANNNKIISIPSDISLLKELEYAYVPFNEILSLPSSIGWLPKLMTLVLNNNKISHLPDTIVQLRNLLRLEVQNNRLVSLQEDFGKLVNLHTLYINNNYLEHLPDSLSRLPVLYRLDISNNNIEKLPANISKFKNIQNLDFVSDFSQRLKEVDLPSIEDKLDYIAMKESGQDFLPINEAKIVFVGDPGVGKTSIRKMIVEGIYDKDQPSTNGIDICPWSVIEDGQEYRLNFWDFGGQEIQHATHQFFFTKRTLYVLVMLAHVEDTYDGVNYWLKLICQKSPDAKILVVVNKIDINTDEINRGTLKKDYPNIVGFVNTTVKQPRTIESLKQAIIRHALRLEHIKDKLPLVWMTIKKAVVVMDKNYITYNEYADICLRHDLTQKLLDPKRLLSLLNDLGSIIHFHDPRLSSLGILKPQWIHNAVYCIVSDKKIKYNKGVCGIDDVERILDNKVYPLEARSYIINIMEKFELCYPVCREHDLYLFPRLSPEEPPEEVNFEFRWSAKDSLRLMLELEILPLYIINRFTVRNYSMIEKNNIWRGGVVIKLGDKARACIRRAIKYPRILIEVRGEENSIREFLVHIRHEFQAIIDPDNQKIYQELVPVAAKTGEEKYLPLEELQDLEHKGYLEHYLPSVGREVDVSELLTGYPSRIDRRTRMDDKPNIFIQNQLEGGKSIVSPSINVNPNIVNTNINSNDLNVFFEMMPTVVGQLKGLKSELEEVSDGDCQELAKRIEKLTKDLEGLESVKTTSEIQRSGVIHRLNSFLQNCLNGAKTAGKIIATAGLTEIVKSLVTHADKLAAAVGISIPL